MKKFEVGKTYRERKYLGDTDVEIKVVRRTDKTITFIYTKPNWWKDNITKEYRKRLVITEETRFFTLVTTGRLRR